MKQVPSYPIQPVSRVRWGRVGWKKYFSQVDMGVVVMVVWMEVEI